jgi:hypothetical protein
LNVHASYSKTGNSSWYYALVIQSTGLPVYQVQLGWNRKYGAQATAGVWEIFLYSKEPGASYKPDARPSSFQLPKELNCKIKPKLKRTGFLSPT